MNYLEYFSKQFKLQQETGSGSLLSPIREDAFDQFFNLGLPGPKNEEWKYTRIGVLFNNDYQLDFEKSSLTEADIDGLRLPGSEEANELVFVNGIFSQELSTVRSRELVVQPLEAAAGNEYSATIRKHFNHSSKYLKDGINALNTAFIQGGIFIYVPERKLVSLPVYIYNVTDARSTPVLSQPRSLVHLGQRSSLSMIETYVTIGAAESMTNQVMEIVVELDAQLSYCKIQNDASHASQVSTTHIRQVGKSVVNAVTISLNGGVVRNNLHAILEAAHSEAHLYGLYFQRGSSHIDNHTVVDNVEPDCLSNELYKGILDNQSTGVFNGKVFVRKDAQKTNAFQSNKNVLLSDTATINTKPQLEIFADDVKCSHGATVGSLDEEGLFYLQSRGIPEKQATALLLQGFAMDVLEKISHAPIRRYIEELIVHRLS